MKIVYFITKSYWGGASKYVIDLASGLDKNNFEIFIASGGQDALKQKAETLGIEYIEISHFERKISIVSDILSFFEVLRLLREVKPDIIHLNSSKAGGVCAAAAFIYKFSGNKLKIIFTAHGWVFHESRPKWQLMLARFLSKITSAFSDNVICITNMDYNSALRYKISDKKKMVLIPNGINIGAVKFFRKKEAQEKLFGGEKPLVVGTVGEWVRNKGWDVLLKAVYPLFDKHPQLTLALIAGGESPEREEIFHERIKVIENLPEASKYLKAFDIFIFPSRKEGLSYALLEASLAELPIIATAVGGNFDIVDSDKTGVLIPPENHETLARTIDKFVRNLKQYKKLGHSARARVENHFSLERMREKTYKLYEN